MARSKARLVAFAVIAGFGPALVACHLITGLDEYDKAQCPGRVCSGDGGDEFEVKNDGPPVDEKRKDDVISADGTAPVSWAHFRMPHYPDAGPPLSDNNELSYSPTNGGLKDNVTNLVWMEPMPAAKNTGLTWAEAKAYCAAQTKDGPWRMPSRIELVTLLDLSLAKSSSARFDSKFTGTQQGPYWTFSEVRPFDVNGKKEHWGVDFGSGRVLPLNENGAQASVRCVRAQ